MINASTILGVGWTSWMPPSYVSRIEVLILKTTTYSSAYITKRALAALSSVAHAVVERMLCRSWTDSTVWFNAVAGRPMLFVV